jgi:hypothetical protein
MFSRPMTGGQFLGELAGETADVSTRGYE